MIKVKSIEFHNPPFRKLGNIRINISDRLTVIAGHNGIGKSTILGLIENTFGLTDGATQKNYFGDHFFTNIEKIIYIALDEVFTSQEHSSAAPTVVTDYNGILIKKRCALTQRADSKRARVVPRTIDKQDGDPVGPDAKIPYPSIYLGMKRLASVGEADEKDTTSKKLSMHEDDSKLLADFIGSVISGIRVTTDVTEQNIKGAKKKSAQPGYELHGPMAISMGQDSLGSIATALASFNKLKRDLGEHYHGGLLIIDELDVGFHPKAIERLVSSLKSLANRLDLQIIATTHSPMLVRCVHPNGLGNERAPDSVIYLLDTNTPRLADDQSLKAILADMHLMANSSGDKKIKPILGVYLEDEEGLEFLDAILPSSKRGGLGRKYGVKIQPIPLGVGGSNLLGMPDKDPLFCDRILLVDADTSISKKAKARGNAVKLPCVKGAAGTDRSPENTIIKFLQSVSTASNGIFYEALLRFSVTNPTSDLLLETFFKDGVDIGPGRESTKKWWKVHSKALKEWGVIREWAICNQNTVDAFLMEFEGVIMKTSQRIK